MSHQTTPNKKANTLIAIEDATGMIKKNAIRRSILLLDKHLIQCQQQSVPSFINFQLCRRLIKASQELIREYVKQQNLKHVDKILDRCNIYIAVAYINLQKMLRANQTEEPSPNLEDMTIVQMEQRLGLARLRQRLRQSIVVQGSLIKVDNLDRLRNKKKVKFYLQEFWSLVMNQLAAYASLFKSSNDAQGTMKMMKKLSNIVKSKEFKSTQSVLILKYIIQYYQMAGALYFQLCEFKLSIDNYDQAIRYVQLLINLILEKEKCPQIYEFKDLKNVIPWFSRLVMLLYLQSYCYQYYSKYSRMRECLHLGLWILDEVLRVDDNNQLKMLVGNRFQEIQQNYDEYISGDAEIVHFIVDIFGTQYEQEQQVYLLNECQKQTIWIQNTFEQKLNLKLYNKFQFNDLNKVQHILIPSQSSSSLIQQSPNSQLCFISQQQSGSKTDREIFQPSKTYQSFTTQDFEVEGQGKRLTTKESVRNSKFNAMTSSKQMRSSRQHKSIDKQPELPKKQIGKTDISQFFFVQDVDYTKLEDQISAAISERMKTAPQFYDLESINEDREYENLIDQKLNRDQNVGKTILTFKKQIARFGLINQPSLGDITRNQLKNRVKTECSLAENCIDAEELLKKVKTDKTVDEKINIQGNKFRKILIKHCKTLGFKRIKKQIVHKDEESALKHMMEGFLTSRNNEQQEKPTPQKIDDGVLLKKTIQTNLNTIKLIMDENEKAQEGATQQLKHRYHSQFNAKQSQLKQQKQQKIAQQYADLAESTNYISVRSEATKKITSIVELANVKRKLHHLERKKTMRYSEVLESELE